MNLTLRRSAAQGGFRMLMGAAVTVTALATGTSGARGAGRPAEISWSSTDPAPTADAPSAVARGGGAPPGIACPADVTRQCHESTDPADTGMAAATDNCDTDDPEVSYADDITTGPCPQEFIIIRTWTAADDCGMASCEQTIAVVDTTPPAISCPADVTIECGTPTDPGSTGGSATATDNCDTNGLAIASTDFVGPGTCPQGSVILRRWSAADDCGNASACVQRITVRDATPPIVTCPADQDVNCNAPPTATDPSNTGTASATDHCDTNGLILAHSDVTSAGDCPQEQTIVRTWTATDDCGNVGSCEQVISVVDNAAPTFLFCPPAVTIECDESRLPGALLGLSSGGIAIYYNNNGGGENPANQAYLKSQVAYGNTNGALFNFNPLGGYGPGHPFQAIPNQFGLDMVLPAPTYDGSVAIPTLTAVDNVNGTIAGATAAGPVTWALNDYQGHPETSAGYLNSLLRGGTPPALGDVLVAQNDLSQSGTVFTVDIAGHLVTDGKMHWHNPAAGQNPDFTTNLSCLGLGDSFYFFGTLSYDSTGDPGTDLIDFYAGGTTLVAKLAGAGTTDVPNVALGLPIVADNCDTCPVTTYSDVFTPNPGCAYTGTITRTWTATDACGNFSTCLQTITVVDTTPPVIECPGNITTNADAGGCDAVVTYSVPATDNCDPSTSVVCTPPSGSIFAASTTVSCTATDACGNSSMCSFDVTVLPINEINIDVELAGVNDPSSRCIHFTADTCANDNDVVLSFVDHDGDDANGNGTIDSTEGGSDSPSTPVRGAGQIILSCGALTSLCAKDEQHTLFDSSALADMGSEYDAALLSLDGGDTDDDGAVDINDVTYFLFTFGSPENAGGCPWDGDRGADFSNNGNTGVEDYTFLSSNWLRTTACGCSGRPGGAHGTSALTSLPVTELTPEIAARADLVPDGLVDHRDVAEFERRHRLPNVLSSKIRMSAGAAQRSD